MPLPLPTLDNRTFDEMFAEGLSTTPPLAPAWTDYNYSDPGITLIDLLTWLTEQDIYRLDRTPDAAYRTFLRLIGVKPHPPRCATTVVVFCLKVTGSPPKLPAGQQVASADKTVVFQTVEPVNVSPAKLQAVLAGPCNSLVDYTAQNGSTTGNYPSFGTQPSPADALYLGFDRALADQNVDLSLYVWAGDAEADKKAQAQLIAEYGSPPSDNKVASSSGICRDLLDWRLHHSVRTRWEYYRKPGTWTALAGVTDETRALTLSGPVRFSSPPAAQQMQGGAAPQYSNLFFIRCRLLHGTYNCVPNIGRIALNAIEARHAADITNGPESLGTSNGQAQQSFTLRQEPVVPGSTKIQVASNPALEWHEELIWDNVGPHSSAYLLSPEVGVITFGDGRVGRVPPSGATITATYQVGGGTSGNVPAQLLVAAVGAPNLFVHQPFSATGGSDAEPLIDAIGRGVRTLAEPTRAVTLADFEQLACQTPGVPIAQAFALADYDPAFPCLSASGCVTVVVIPKCPQDRPQPDSGFLRAVARYLGRRRVVTSEVRVIGPTYTVVSVSARLNVATGVDSQQLSQLAVATLARFLNPFTGGPNGTGWPVGRSVYRAEIMALLQDLAGVIYVDALTLQADGGCPSGCDNLTICRHALVASGQHKITVRAAGGSHP